MASLVIIQQALVQLEESLASARAITRGEVDAAIRGSIIVVNENLRDAIAYGFWTRAEFQQVVVDLVQKLTACTCTLREGARALSPAGVMLLSGPFARRLQTSFMAVKQSILRLSIVLAMLLPSSNINTGAFGSGSSGAGGNGARRLATAIQYHNQLDLNLVVLYQREARAQTLRQHLRHCLSPQLLTATPASHPRPPTSTATGLDRTGAVSCVREALQSEGMAAESVSHPQVVPELMRELYCLVESPLLEPEDTNLIMAVTSALQLGIAIDAYKRPSDAGEASLPTSGSAADRGAGDPSPDLAVPRPLDSFVCPLTLEVMIDPVITPDGHTYDREALEKWVQPNGTDPQTRKRLASGDLRPNRAMKDAIQQWVGRLDLSVSQYNELLRLDSDAPRVMAAGGPSGADGAGTANLGRASSATSVAAAGAAAAAILSHVRAAPPAIAATASAVDTTRALARATAAADPAAGSAAAAVASPPLQSAAALMMGNAMLPFSMGYCPQQSAPRRISRASRRRNAAVAPPPPPSPPAGAVAGFPSAVPPCGTSTSGQPRHTFGPEPMAVGAAPAPVAAAAGGVGSFSFGTIPPSVAPSSSSATQATPISIGGGNGDAIMAPMRPATAIAWSGAAMNGMPAGALYNPSVRSFQDFQTPQAAPFGNGAGLSNPSPAAVAVFPSFGYSSPFAATLSANPVFASPSFTFPGGPYPSPAAAGFTNSVAPPAASGGHTLLGPFLHVAPQQGLSGAADLGAYVSGSMPVSTLPNQASSGGVQAA